MYGPEESMLAADQSLDPLDGRLPACHYGHAGPGFASPMPRHGHADLSKENPAMRASVLNRRGSSRSFIGNRNAPAECAPRSYACGPDADAMLQ